QASTIIRYQRRCPLEPRLLRVVGVADRLAQATIQFAAAQNHYFRVHGFRSVERHLEGAYIFRINHQRGPSARADRSYRAELLASVRDECLETDLNFSRIFYAMRARQHFLNAFD